MTDHNGGLAADTVAHQYAPDTQALIAAARRALTVAFPGATETVDQKARVIGYSYGQGYKGTVATLILSKRGVKIGIPYGATLADPAELLTGAGKVHRHVPIATPDQLRTPALRALLRAVRGAWKARTTHV